MISNQRSKFYCKSCDIVSKARHGAKCPGCGADMKNMGMKWRPGKRGSRTRMWDRRREHQPPFLERIAYGSRNVNPQSTVPQHRPSFPWYYGTIWLHVIPNIHRYRSEQELIEKIARG